MRSEIEIISQVFCLVIVISKCDLRTKEIAQVAGIGYFSVAKDLLKNHRGALRLRILLVQNEHIDS